METRADIVKGFYAKYKEEERLDSDRQGQMEYITTMHYIHEYLKPGNTIAEIGAGTGRISIALAKEGYDVTAVEYSDDNYEKLEANIADVENIRAYQGDAINLSMLDNDSFDVVLLFGPMYHLYDCEEQAAALREASRITKPGGTVLIAFLSVHAIMYTNYVCNRGGEFVDGFKHNFDERFEVKHFPEQLFTGFDIAEFETLVDASPLQREKTVACDGMLELAKLTPMFGLEGNENFEKFVAYHLATCERRELLGLSSHLLCICHV
ncbi:MAG: class I SAM-dependent methyltransferase [Lachnospiraceae bacterium]|nr:class I SAM-dependent methyltransferase [Lachnospiraceae bacterium]